MIILLIIGFVLFSILTAAEWFATEEPPKILVALSFLFAIGLTISISVECQPVERTHVIEVSDNYTPSSDSSPELVFDKPMKIEWDEYNDTFFHILQPRRVNIKVSEYKGVDK